MASTRRRSSSVTFNGDGSAPTAEQPLTHANDSSIIMANSTSQGFLHNPAATPRRGLLAAVRRSRNEFFSRFDDSHQTGRLRVTVHDTPDVRSQFLAVGSMVLSTIVAFPAQPGSPVSSTAVKYDTATSSGESTAAPITIDRVLASANLPLFLSARKNLTLQEAHAALCSVAKREPQLVALEVSVDITQFDTLICEQTDEYGPAFEVAKRHCSVSVHDLRDAILESQQSGALLIVFADHYVIHGGLLVDDDEEPQAAGDDVQEGGASDGELRSNESSSIQVNMQGSFRPAKGLEAKPKKLKESLRPLRTDRRETCCGIVVAMTQQNEMAEVAFPEWSPGRLQGSCLGINTVEVPLSTLHKAIATRNSYTNRPHGFLSVRTPQHATAPGMGLSMSGSHQLVNGAVPSPTRTSRKASQHSEGGGGVLNLSVVDTTTESPARYLERGNTSPSNNALTDIPRILSAPPEFAVGKVLDPFQEAPSLHVQPFQIEACVASHITTLAYALALLSGEAKTGLDVNSIVTGLRLPPTCLLSPHLAFHQEFSHMYTYVRQAKLPYKMDVLPFLQLIRRAGASITTSVEQLATILANLKASDELRHGVIIMVAFNPDATHGAVGLNGNDSLERWAIIGGYDEETQTVSLIDASPKRFGRFWSANVSLLHRGMANAGLVIIAKDSCDITPLLVWQESESAEVAQARHLAKTLYLSPHSLPQAVRDPTVPNVPLSLAAAAASVILQKPISFTDMIRDAPCSLCFFSGNVLSLPDFTRLANRMLAQYGLVAKAVHVTDSTDAKKRNESLAQMRQTLKTINDNPTEGGQVIFNFIGDKVASQQKHKSDQGDFAWCLGSPDASRNYVMQDTTADECQRQWVVDVEDLFDACHNTCRYSKRSMGYVVISKKKDHASSSSDSSSQRRKRHICPPMDTFRTPTAHPLRSCGCPIVAAFATALTSLGFPTSAERFAYSAIAHFPPSFLQAAPPTLADCCKLFDVWAEASLNNKAFQATIRPLRDALAEAGSDTRVLVQYGAHHVHRSAAGPLTSAAIVTAIINSGGSPTTQQDSDVLANPETEAELCEAETSSYPASWRASISDLEGDGSITGCIVVVRKNQNQPKNGDQQ